MIAHPDFAPKDLADLVGRPYALAGRGPHAFDCWGIVLEAFARAHVALPDYEGITAKDTLQVARHMRRDPHAIGFHRIKDAPKFMDVVVMRPDTRPDQSIPDHVALCLDKVRILQADDAADSHVTTLLAPMIAARVLGIYRHEAFGGGDTP